MIELHYIVLMAFTIAGFLIGLGSGVLIQIVHRRKVKFVRRRNRLNNRQW